MSEAIINEAINSVPFHISVGSDTAIYSYIIREYLVTATFNRRTTATDYSIEPLPASLC